MPHGMIQIIFSKINQRCFNADVVVSECFFEKNESALKLIEQALKKSLLGVKTRDCTFLGVLLTIMSRQLNDESRLHKKSDRLHLLA